jgi:hypothetical protein
MRVEALLPRLGELRVEDVRLVLGATFWEACDIDAHVLAPVGGVPSSQRVALGWKRSGRGDHRALICPACHAPREILYTDGGGGLACAGCLKRRTREQQELNTRAWRQLGGREEDRLLRLLRRDRLPSAGLDQARALAEEILCGDRDRLDALHPRIDAALRYREVRAR